LLKAARELVQGETKVESESERDERLESLLVRMTDAAEDLDVGVDLIKAAGAPDVIRHCLASSTRGVVRECARFVGTTAANESRAQKVLVEGGVLGQLLAALRREAVRTEDECDERLLVALVGALSAMVDEGLATVLVAQPVSFVNLLGGALVRSRSRRVYARIFVLFRKLAVVNPASLAAEIVAAPAILHVACASCVDTKSITLRDTAVRFLRPLLAASPDAVALCKSVQLDTLLRERIARAAAATTEDEEDDLEGVEELLAIIGKEQEK
jgi:hypothetical protein